MLPIITSAIHAWNHEKEISHHRLLIGSVASTWFNHRRKFLSNSQVLEFGKDKVGSVRAEAGNGGGFSIVGHVASTIERFTVLECGARWYAIEKEEKLAAYARREKRSSVTRTRRSYIPISSSLLSSMTMLPPSVHPWFVLLLLRRSSFSIHVRVGRAP